MSYIKIPSGEITNLPYLIHVAKNKKDNYFNVCVMNMKLKKHLMS